MPFIAFTIESVVLGQPYESFSTYQLTQMSYFFRNKVFCIYMFQLLNLYGIEIIITVMETVLNENPSKSLLTN